MINDSNIIFLVIIFFMIIAFFIIFYTLYKQFISPTSIKKYNSYADTTESIKKIDTRVSSLEQKTNNIIKDIEQIKKKINL